MAVYLTAHDARTVSNDALMRSATGDDSEEDFERLIQANRAALEVVQEASRGFRVHLREHDYPA